MSEDGPGHGRRTVRDLRRTNRASVLRRLYFEGPLSRQELGPATGLSSGSISNVVTGLLADGVLEEAGSVRPHGGRPRTMLRVAAHSACVAGVDVGETRVRVELFDLRLNEIARSEAPLAQVPAGRVLAGQILGAAAGGGHDPARVVRLVEQGLAAVLARVGPDTGPLLGVGVGVPGIVEQRPEGGALVHGQTVGWDAVPLEAMLREALTGAAYGRELCGRESYAREAGERETREREPYGRESYAPEPCGRRSYAREAADGRPDAGPASLGPESPGPAPVRPAPFGPGTPLHLDNGAKTLGQAEMWFGAGRGARDAVIALLGSGVGACVVTGGEPYGGAAGTAGEWGHTVLAVGGRRCRCGARGCLEAYVGAGAVLDRWRAAGGAPSGDDEETALAELLDAADASGPRARAARDVLAGTAEYLGAGIADLVNLFNPERIVIGGWAGLLLGPRLLPAVREATAAYALRYPAARTAVELCRLGPDAVTMGAATLPLRRFLDAGGSPPSGVAPAR